MTSKTRWMVAGILLACGVSVSAQMDPNMKMDAPQSSGAGFMRDMDVAMKKMDYDMAAAPMNGNADHDFVTMMIPHHAGAIDMAEGELKYGKKPGHAPFGRRNYYRSKIRNRSDEALARKTGRNDIS